MERDLCYVVYDEEFLYHNANFGLKSNLLVWDSFLKQ